MSPPNTIRSLVRSWFWLHVGTLLALVAQPSTPASILGRYSRTAALVITAFILFTPVMYWGTHWLANYIERESIRLATWSAIIILVGIALLVFALWVTGPGPTPAYIVVWSYLTIVLLSIGVWAALSIVSVPHKLAAHLGWVFAVICCAALLILASHFPPLLWTDEGYNASVAVSFARYRRLFSAIFPLAPSAAGPIFSTTYMLLGIWFSIWGTTLAAARILTLLIGFAGLVFLQRTVTRLYSSLIAWPTVLLIAFTLSRSNFLRADVALVLYLSIAFYAFVRARQDKRSWLHIVVGLVIGFSLDAHPNAYRFVIGFGLAYLFEYARYLAQRRRFFIYRPFIYLLTGSLVGVAFYVGLYLFLAPDAFGLKLHSPEIRFDLAQVIPVAINQITSALNNAPLLSASAICGLVVALKRRAEIDRLLLLVTLSAFLILGLLYGYYRDYYLEHIVVPLALLASGAFSWLSDQIPISRRPTVLAVLTTLVLITCVAWLLQSLRTSDGQSYDEALTVADQIRAIVPREERFVGIDPFYWRLYDYSNFIEVNTGIMLAQRDKITELAAWEQIGATSIAVVSGYPIQPTSALRQYIQENEFERIRCWKTKRLGQVELFMHRVPEGVTPIRDCLPLASKP